MRPPMRQTCSVYQSLFNVDGTPLLDKYGKPKTIKVESIARVRRKGNLIITKTGTETNTNIEIDVPTSTMIKDGNKIDFVDMDGIRGTGTVINYEEATNLTGSRVLFRTVYVDGR
ncbi:hypothetical protein [Macrococcus animalis]|uniref:hypothetical protein n=1 Tax=Macrococcus animalis TaxID=3395467 RepID=UPI0039BECC41